MKDDKKSSIIRDALTDYNAIVEAANANAKNKLAAEFPEKFNSLINEELNKNKKNIKESYKKIEDEKKESEKSDDNTSKKESDMKKQEKETTKVEENVEIKSTDVVKPPFEEKTEKMKDGATESNVTITDTVGDDKPFDEKGKKMVDEAFDISDLDIDSVEESLDNAGEDDIITFDDIENEINEIENLGEELEGMNGLPRPQANFGTHKGQGGDAFTKLTSMKNQIDEMLKEMEMSGETVEQSNELAPNEMNAEPIEEEEEDGITDADIDAILGGEEGVDEAMQIDHAAGNITTGKLGDHDGTHGRFRGMNENKRIAGLVNENKKLTKKLNEFKKSKDSAITLVENYKTALEKYRNQLKEMAVFNTNLAHVNNLLVNEGLALTQADKIKIINEFKKVGSITESQDKYKNFLSEMKENKKTITESIGDKVTASIQPSSKQKLDEVVEKTAYENDEHIKKMKSLIEYVENRGKNRIN